MLGSVLVFGAIAFALAAFAMLVTGFFRVKKPAVVSAPCDPVTLPIDTGARPQLSHRPSAKDPKSP